MAAVRSPKILAGLQTLVLGVAALYFGRPVLVPLVVAVLFTFLLMPAVSWLERRRFRRVPAVIFVAMAVLLFMASIGWTFTQQFHVMALHLNEYQGHLRDRMQVFRGSRIQSIENIKSLIREVGETTPPTPPDELAPPVVQASGEAPSQANKAGGASEKPPEVVTVIPKESSTAASVQAIWSALSTPLTSAAVVFVLVFFMLVEFEEMRNRLLRLAGKGRLTLTTRTLDDVGRRISRFLMMNALVNGGFGLLVYLGLLVIGVDYAALWGGLAALLRFVPYLGAIIAAALPFTMAVVQFPDWLHPFMALGWFLLLEIITNSIVEPLTYGKTAGVSTVALLVAATFWSWIWGPMGLLLSVPLTVVLSVLGKNIPQFNVLGVLLSEEPALAPREVLYQRLLAGDVDEASNLVDDQLAALPPERVYDELLIPALSLAERDQLQGTLDQQEKDAVWGGIRDVLEDQSRTERSFPHAVPRLRVVGCSAQNLADDLALAMLQHATPAGCELTVLSSERMVSEKLAEFSRNPPDAVLISAVAPGGESHVRYLCKRIRQEFPRLRIIVGRWSFQGDRERLANGLRLRGADQVVINIAEALDAFQRIQPVSQAV